ncbi:hypothetical protein NEDG_01147 [Nematocida displodere]|uniref:Uncharacterized protein n=1 Tax=Nematocida displodere TaxID=1805483 RepID=A0A177EB23_9MICR|nr:hypothetical protein NEDG_01147 [Nematocida displodere]
MKICLIAVMWLAAGICASSSLDQNAPTRQERHKSKNPISTTFGKIKKILSRTPSTKKTGAPENFPAMSPPLAHIKTQGSYYHQEENRPECPKKGANLAKFYFKKPVPASPTQLSKSLTHFDFCTTLDENSAHPPSAPNTKVASFSSLTSADPNTPGTSTTAEDVQLRNRMHRRCASMPDTGAEKATRKQRLEGDLEDDSSEEDHVYMPPLDKSSSEDIWPEEALANALRKNNLRQSTTSSEDDYPNMADSINLGSPGSAQKPAPTARKTRGPMVPIVAESSVVGSIMVESSVVESTVVETQSPSIASMNLGAAPPLKPKQLENPGPRLPPRRKTVGSTIQPIPLPALPHTATEPRATTQTVERTLAPTETPPKSLFVPTQSYKRLSPERKTSERQVIPQPKQDLGAIYARIEKRAVPPPHPPKNRKSLHQQAEELLANMVLDMDSVEESPISDESKEVGDIYHNSHTEGKEREEDIKWVNSRDLTILMQRKKTVKELREQLKSIAEKQRLAVGLAQTKLSRSTYLIPPAENTTNTSSLPRSNCLQFGSSSTLPRAKKNPHHTPTSTLPRGGGLQSILKRSKSQGERQNNVVFDLPTPTPTPSPTQETSTQSLTRFTKSIGTDSSLRRPVALSRSTSQTAVGMPEHVPTRASFNHGRASAFYQVSEKQENARTRPHGSKRHLVRGKSLKEATKEATKEPGKRLVRGKSLKEVSKESEAKVQNQEILINTVFSLMTDIHNRGMPNMIQRIYIDQGYDRVIDRIQNLNQYMMDIDDIREAFDTVIQKYHSKGFTDYDMFMLTLLFSNINIEVFRVIIPQFFDAHLNFKFLCRYYGDICKEKNLHHRHTHDAKGHMLKRGGGFLESYIRPDPTTLFIIKLADRTLKNLPGYPKSPENAKTPYAKQERFYEAFRDMPHLLNKKGKAPIKEPEQALRAQYKSIENARPNYCQKLILGALQSTQVNALVHQKKTNANIIEFLGSVDSMLYEKGFHPNTRNSQSTYLGIEDYQQCFKEKLGFLNIGTIGEDITEALGLLVCTLKTYNLVRDF